MTTPGGLALARSSETIDIAAGSHPHVRDLMKKKRATMKNSLAHNSELVSTLETAVKRDFDHNQCGNESRACSRVKRRALGRKVWKRDKAGDPP